MFRQLGLEDYSEVNIQVLGAEDSYGAHAHNTVSLTLLYSTVLFFILLDIICMQ